MVEGSALALPYVIRPWVFMMKIWNVVMIVMMMIMMMMKLLVMVKMMIMVFMRPP